MKRILGLFLCLIMTGSLAACGQNTEPSAAAPTPAPAETQASEPAAPAESTDGNQAQPPAAEPAGAQPLDMNAVTGKIVVTTPYDPERYAPDWVAAFNEAYPNIEIEFVMHAGSDTGQLQINSEILAGAGPDVIWNHGPEYLQTRIDEELIVDMDELMARTNFDPEALIGYPCDFYNFGIPSIFHAPELVWFNVDMFEDAGIPIPGEDWTIADLEAIAAQMTKGEGSGKVFGFCPYHDLNEWAWFARCTIGENYLYNADGMSNYDNPHFKQSLQWYADMQNSGNMVNYADLLSSGETPATYLLQKRAAMVLSAGPVPRTMATSADTMDFQVTCRPMPLLQEDGPHYTGAGFQIYFSINKNTKSPEAAWTFINWVSTEGAKWFANVGFVPSIKDSPFSNEELAGIMLGDAIKFMDVEAMGKYFFDYDYVGPVYEISNLTAYNEVKAAGRDNAMLVFTGEQSVDDAITKMKQDADAALEQALN